MFYAASKVVARTQPDKNGLHLICLRVTYARKSRYYSLNMKAVPNEWSAESCRFSRARTGYKRDNELLASKEARALDILRDMERDGEAFTFDEFEARFTATNRPTTKVVVSVLSIAAAFESNEQPGSADMYKRLAKRLREYKPHAVMSDLGPKFLQGFEAYLERTRDMNGGGMSLLFRTFKAACNRWKKDKVITVSPFADFATRHMRNTPEKTGLRSDQITALFSVPPETKAEQLALDLFRLSFYLWGMNIADLAALTRSSVKGGRVEYVRQKTGRKYSVVVSDAAQAILSRYNTSSAGYILPIYNEKHDTERKRRTRRKNLMEDLNKALKTVGARAGIPAALCFMYNARHSFATILKDKGTDIMLIAEILGHSDIRITAGYLQDFKAAVLDAAATVALGE